MTICGIDEVGRGCLAGPVIACAVVFHGSVPEGVRDSKRLSESTRRRLDQEIRAVAHVSLGTATCEEIDRINILQATMTAMRRAYDGLPAGIGTTRIMIDGNRAPEIDTTCEVSTMVGGDDLVKEIAAASIVAKVYRDALMARLHDEHPQYDWTSNKGYGSPRHLAGIMKHGPTPHHRMTFAPLRQPMLGL